MKLKKQANDVLARPLPLPVPVRSRRNPEHPKP